MIRVGAGRVVHRKEPFIAGNNESLPIEGSRLPEQNRTARPTLSIVVGGSIENLSSRLTRICHLRCVEQPQYPCALFKQRRVLKRDTYLLGDDFRLRPLVGAFGESRDDNRNARFVLPSSRVISTQQVAVAQIQEVRGMRTRKHDGQISYLQSGNGRRPYLSIC